MVVRPHTMTIVERFWSYVRKSNGCWLWFGWSRKGYGQFRYGKSAQKAHRIAWELTYGPIPFGLQVLHKCDTPLCVNPGHLFLGTQAENIIDAVNKGRLNLSECGKKRSNTAKRDWHGRFC